MQKIIILSAIKNGEARAGSASSAKLKQKMRSNMKVATHQNLKKQCYPDSVSELLTTLSQNYRVRIEGSFLSGVFPLPL